MGETQPTAEREKGALTVVLLEGDEAIREGIAGYFANQQDIVLHTASDEARARDLLASKVVDCLVADPTHLTVDESRFAIVTQTLSPDCSVIWLLPGKFDGEKEQLLQSGESLIEKGDHDTDWRFLAEKLRAVVRGGPTRRGPSETYRLLVESARDGLYQLDANGHFIYLNESFAELAGYERDELLGAHATDVMGPGELERGQEATQEVLSAPEKESGRIDMTFVRKDGEEIYISLQFVVLTAPDGTYDGIMGVARDITERKHREEELKRQNERLDAFAGAISHDLRNPLNVAQLQLDLVSRECESDHVEPVADALNRMETLIDDLLTLARDGTADSDPVACSLRTVATEAFETVETADATLDVVSDCSIRAHRSSLQQLFENLIRNAVEHGDDDVTITVGKLPDNPGFFLEDDGPGIPEEEREQVFTAGYSTATSGSGLGLRIVSDIVDRHDWTISVESTETGGARFVVSDVSMTDW